MRTNQVPNFRQTWQVPVTPPLFSPWGWRCQPAATKEKALASSGNRWIFVFGPLAKDRWAADGLRVAGGCGGFPPGSTLSVS